MDVTHELTRRAPGWARPAVVLGVKTLRDSFEDRVPGLAAEIAFYFILSLPPLALAVLGSVGFVEDLLGTDVAVELRRQLLLIARQVFSADTIEAVVAPTIDTLLEEGRGDVASFGILFTLWSASRALNVLLAAISIAYDLEEEIVRPGWKRRLVALGLTLVAILAGIVVIPLLIAGPSLARALTEPLGIASELGTAWDVLYWPIVAALAMLVLASLYHYGALWWTPWRRDLPGAVLAVVVWLLGSIALRAYAATTIEGNATYQQLSAPLVLLLWLYVLGFGMLLGAELNAEIDKLYPTSHERPPERTWWRPWTRRRPATDDAMTG